MPPRKYRTACTNSRTKKSSRKRGLYMLAPTGSAATQFACMHAAVQAGLTPFQVFACDDGAVGLFGEFDQACQIALGRALRRIQLAPNDSKLIFDMSAVRFMDHHALLALDSYAQKCQVPVCVRSMPRIVGRVARVLGLEHLGSMPIGGS